MPKDESTFPSMHISLLWNCSLLKPTQVHWRRRSRRGRQCMPSQTRILAQCKYCHFQTLQQRNLFQLAWPKCPKRDRRIICWDRRQLIRLDDDTWFVSWHRIVWAGGILSMLRIETIAEQTALPRRQVPVVALCWVGSLLLNGSPLSLMWCYYIRIQVVLSRFFGRYHRQSCDDNEIK